MVAFQHGKRGTRRGRIRRPLARVLCCPRRSALCLLHRASSSGVSGSGKVLHLRRRRTTWAGGQQPGCNSPLSVASRSLVTACFQTVVWSSACGLHRMHAAGYVRLCRVLCVGHRDVFVAQLPAAVAPCFISSSWYGLGSRPLMAVGGYWSSGLTAVSASLRT